MRFSFLIAILFCSTVVLAQRNFQDFETWYKFKMSTKMDEKLTLSASPAFRLNENSLQFNSAFVDVAAVYKVHKYFKPKLNVRLGVADRFDRGRYSFMRVNTGLRTAVDLWRFTFEFRDRFQYDRALNSGGFTNRTRMRVVYEMDKDIQFFSAGELFFELGEAIPMQKYRFSFGFDIDAGKGKDLKVYYMRQGSTDSRVPQRINVIGAIYKMKIKFN